MTRSQPRGRALITGASSTIGAIYAHRLAARGYDLVLAAHDARSLDSFAAWMTKQTGRLIETIETDGGAAAPHIQGLEQRIARDADLTLLVNNAAAAHLEAPAGNTVEALIALNASVPARLAYAAATAFAGRLGGAIINIAPAADPPDADSASRSFLRALSQALDSELRSAGVRAQAVLPLARAAAFWELAGSRVEHLPREIVLLAEDLVDQALYGLDNGEVVSRPRLPDQSRDGLLAGDYSRTLHDARG